MEKELEATSETEEQTEAEDGRNDRIETLLDAEEELKEELASQHEGTTDHSVDLSSVRNDVVERLPVLGGRREDDTLVLEVLDGTEEREVSIPWPDDPTDPNEPLVRVAEMCNLSIDRIGDLKELPVVRYEGEIHPVALPPYEDQTWKVTLPGHRVLSFEVPALRKLFKRKASELALSIADFGGYEVTKKRGDVHFTIDDRFTMTISAIFALLIIFPSILLATAPVIPIFVTFIFTLIHGMMFFLLSLSALLMYEDVTMVSQDTVNEDENMIDEEYHDVDEPEPADLDETPMEE